MCAGDDVTIVGEPLDFKSFKSPYDKKGEESGEDPEEEKKIKGIKDPEEGRKIGPIDRSSIVDEKSGQDQDQKAFSSAGGQLEEEKIGMEDISTILQKIKTDGKNPQEFLEKVNERFGRPVDMKWSGERFPTHCPISEDPVYGTYFRRLQKCLACECEARECYLAKMGLPRCEECGKKFDDDGGNFDSCLECWPDSGGKCDKCKKWKRHEYGYWAEISVEATRQCAGFEAGLACCDGGNLCYDCGRSLRECSGEGCGKYCCEQTLFRRPCCHFLGCHTHDDIPHYARCREWRCPCEENFCIECMEAKGWRPNIPRRDESDEN